MREIRHCRPPPSCAHGLITTKIPLPLSRAIVRARSHLRARAREHRLSAARYYHFLIGYVTLGEPRRRAFYLNAARRGGVALRRVTSAHGHCAEQLIVAGASVSASIRLDHQRETRSSAGEFREKCRLGCGFRSFWHDENFDTMGGINAIIFSLRDNI